jgi:hypothetical protein
MNALRRYEILLPLRFNDGTPVSEALLAEVFAELRVRFGAASWETQTVHGEWQQDEAVYRDDLVRFFVDVQDSTANRDFFRQFKSTLKARFQQIDIWMTSHPVDVI